MIRPTTLDLVRAVRASFAQEIRPTLTDPVARSYATTIDALLLQIENRVAYGQSLVRTDIADLRETLAAIADLLDRAEEAEPTRTFARAVRRSITEVPAAGLCAAPDAIDAEAWALRGHFGSCQAALRDPENQWSGDRRTRVQALVTQFVDREVRRESRIHHGVARNAY